MNLVGVAFKGRQTPSVIIKSQPKKCFSDLTWILPDLKKLARTYAGFDIVENIFYSRKNFLRPDLQPESCAFENEVALLDAKETCVMPLDM